MFHRDEVVPFAFIAGLFTAALGVASNIAL